MSLHVQPSPEKKNHLTAPFQVSHTTYLKIISIPGIKKENYYANKIVSNTISNLLGARSWTRPRSRCGTTVVVIIMITIATTTIFMTIIFFIVISSVCLIIWFFFHDWRPVPSILTRAFASRTTTVATPVPASVSTFTATARSIMKCQSIKLPTLKNNFKTKEFLLYLDLLFFLLRRSSSRRPLLSSRSRLRLRERDRDLDRRSRERLRERDLWC